MLPFQSKGAVKNHCTQHTAHSTLRKKQFFDAFSCEAKLLKFAVAMLSRVLQINEKERNLFQHKSNKKSEERRKLCRRNSVVVRYLILLRHHYIVTAHKWTNSDFVNAILYMLCKTYIKDSLQDCVRLWR